MSNTENNPICTPECALADAAESEATKKLIEPLLGKIDKLSLIAALGESKIILNILKKSNDFSGTNVGYSIDRLFINLGTVTHEHDMLSGEITRLGHPLYLVWHCDVCPDCSEPKYCKLYVKTEDVIMYLKEWLEKGYPIHDFNNNDQLHITQK